MSSLLRTMRREMVRNGYTSKDKILNRRIGKAAKAKSMTRAEFKESQRKEAEKANGHA